MKNLIASALMLFVSACNPPGCPETLRNDPCIRMTLPGKNDVDFRTYLICESSIRSFPREHIGWVQTYRLDTEQQVLFYQALGNEPDDMHVDIHIVGCDVFIINPKDVSDYHYRYEGHHREYCPHGDKQPYCNQDGCFMK